MDTDALRWFQQVADGTTVTEVSELEPVTQPGVSRALARLEAQVGTPLLRKCGGILRMSHAGATFKRHVDAPAAPAGRRDRGRQPAAGPRRRDGGAGIPALGGTWLVPDLVEQLSGRRIPGVRLAADPGPRRVRGSARPVEQADCGPGDRHPQEPRRAARQCRAAQRGGAAEGGGAARAPGPAGRRGRHGLGELSGEPFVALRPGSALRGLATSCAWGPGSGPTWCSRGTTCRPCAGSWPRAWAWPSCRRRARGRRRLLLECSATWRSAADVGRGRSRRAGPGGGAAAAGLWSSSGCM